MAKRIGKHDIVRKLGDGRFGPVYEGRDPLIGRQVAIKTCEATDEEARRRFFREAEVAGSLNHHNIGKIYELGVFEGIPYAVQEFLPEDLERLMRRREPMPLSERLRILIEAADGLDCLLAAGFAPPPLPPAGIRIAEDGQAKIMDLGTSGPEPPDERAAVRRLGMLARDLLAWRGPPASGPVAGLAPDTPARLSAIVSRAMEERPERRHRSVAEFRERLAAVHAELTGRPVPLEMAPALSRSLPRGGAASALPAIAAAAARAGRGLSQSLTTTLQILSRARRTLRLAAAAALCFFAVSGATILLWPTEAPKPKARLPAGEVPATEAPASPPAAGPAPVLASADPLAVLVAGSGLEGKTVEQQPGATGEGATYGPSTIRIEFAGGAARRRERLALVSQNGPSEPRSSDPPLLAGGFETAARRYARAAEESGLSSETRAHLYLQSAHAYHAAGDEARAHQSLQAAFSWSPSLRLGTDLADTPFARLAEAVRGGRRLPSSRAPLSLPTPGLRSRPGPVRPDDAQKNERASSWKRRRTGLKSRWPTSG